MDDTRADLDRLRARESVVRARRSRRAFDVATLVISTCGVAKLATESKPGRAEGRKDVEVVVEHVAGLSVLKMMHLE